MTNPSDDDYWALKALSCDAQVSPSGRSFGSAPIPAGEGAVRRGARPDLVELV